MEKEKSRMIEILKEEEVSEEVIEIIKRESKKKRPTKDKKISGVIPPYDLAEVSREPLSIYK